MLKRNIPNVFTCLNLFCGCIAIVFAFQGNLVWTAYMVGIAAVMDFLDGFVARLLNVNSEIGKQLDSMADMVSFGVVPGVVMFKLLELSLSKHILVELEYFSPQGNGYMDHQDDIPYSWIALVPYLGFLLTVFSGIRLAKFNIDTRQSDSFIGVPTPANAILICSIGLIIPTGFICFPDPIVSAIQDMFLNLYFLCGLSLIMSYLLISELPLFALKFKNFGWSDNKVRYIFLILSLAMLIIFWHVGIPFIIVLYIVISMINNLIDRKTKTRNS